VNTVVKLLSIFGMILLLVVGARAAIIVDGTPIPAEIDPTWVAASGSVVYTELDPSWTAASGSVVYTELDPSWTAASGGVRYTTGLISTNAMDATADAAYRNVAGGGGGGNADDTNYWGQLAYGSNDWHTLPTGVTNDCIFSLEVADFGNMCDPATGFITTRKTGWWEVYASYWMVHPIGIQKIGIFSAMTNDCHWISTPISSTYNMSHQAQVYHVQTRAYLPSGTVVRCTFYHNNGTDRVAGGYVGHADGSGNYHSYPDNVSVFIMDFIQE
jgi:hypothetical protein